MNAKRRKELARILDELTALKEQFDAVRDEEQEAYDNTPENLQESERGQQTYECISLMDEAFSCFESTEEQIQAVIEN